MRSVKMTEMANIESVAQHLTNSKIVTRNYIKYVI